MNTVRSLQKMIGGTLHSGGCGADTGSKIVGPVAIDSRQVQRGAVFWGLSGTNHDGADFAGEAFQRGAAGVVVSRPVDLPAGRWALQVPDTLEALQGWAATTRRKFAGTVIAVTGSVGKTTARQMIHTVLQSRLVGTASPRNYNNHIGLPLSMLAMEPWHDYAVLEIGASAPGEIARLARLCKPDIGVITQVGDAHLAGFGSRHGVAEAKAELLAALPPNGEAVLCDDPTLRRLAEQCPAPVTWFGRGADCDVAATDVRSSQGRLDFSVDGCEFSLPVWGRHHLSAALAAVAVARLMGLALEEAAQALAGFNPLPMRCEVLRTRGATIINDTYNASPVAMHAALELLRDFDTDGRRILVCGDMAELGEESTLLHARLGSEVVTQCGADLLIACGRFAENVVAGARAAGMPSNRSIPCSTPDETLPYLDRAIAPGDVVLVKGSRAMAMERVVAAMQETRGGFPN